MRVSQTVLVSQNTSAEVLKLKKNNNNMDLTGETV